MSKFKKGDIVRCIDASFQNGPLNSRAQFGHLYAVSSVSENGGVYLTDWPHHYFFARRFELVVERAGPVVKAEAERVYRPGSTRQYPDGPAIDCDCECGGDSPPMTVGGAIRYLTSQGFTITFK